MEKKILKSAVFVSILIGVNGAAALFIMGLWTNNLSATTAVFFTTVALIVIYILSTYLLDAIKLIFKNNKHD